MQAEGGLVPTRFQWAFHGRTRAAYILDDYDPEMVPDDQCRVPFQESAPAESHVLTILQRIGPVSDDGQTTRALVTMVRNTRREAQSNVLAHGARSDFR
jgi:hypothetical protein